MNIPKPSFSNHPGNYCLVLVVGLLAFFAVSIANAGTYTAGYYWQMSSGNGPNPIKKSTPEGACQQWFVQNGTAYGSYNGITYQDPNTYQCKSTSFPSVGAISRSNCNGDTTSEWCTDPTAPQNCTDLQYSSFTITQVNAPLEICNYGCQAYAAGVGVVLADYTSQTYTYSGTSCPGGSGYDPAKAYEDPALDPEAPPKVCKDANGYIYGSVSANAECPTRQNCYDENGTLTNTVDGSSSCPTGTATNAETDWQQNVTTEQTTSTTTNPDGSTESTTEQTETHAGSDGKTYTTTRQVTETCDAQGVCTTTETGVDGMQHCEGEDCTDENGQTLEGATSCNTEYVCKGDLYECAALELQREQACALTEDAVDSWVGSQDFADNVAVDVDADGQLSVLDGGTVDVEQAFGISGWLVDDGVTASCPAVVEGWIELDMGPLCSFFSAMRYPVLFFNGIAILWFVRRSTLEAS